MARKDRVWTPSAEVSWSGDMGPEFRAKAEKILDPKSKTPRRLTEAAWEGLWRVVFSYASELAHDWTAGDASKQRALVAQAVEQSSKLLATLEQLETVEMGRAMTNLLNDAWAEEYDHEGEFDRDLAIATEELTSVTKAETADLLMTTWQRRNFICRPSPTADFQNRLHVFNAAAKRAGKNLDSGAARKGTDPFDQLIAMLCVWQEEHKIKAGATRLDAYENGHGALTYLVKAILAEVPELHDADGKSLPKQIRRYTDITDATLADYVVKARARHHQRMKALGEEAAR